MVNFYPPLLFILEATSTDHLNAQIYIWILLKWYILLKIYIKPYQLFDLRSVLNVWKASAQGKYKCVPGSWPTKNLKRPEASKFSPPAYTVNGLSNLVATSHIRFPGEQLLLFTLPKMYATSHMRPINRKTALCSECQSDSKRTSPLLRMQASLLQPMGTAEQGAPRHRLCTLPLLAVKSSQV